VGGGYWGATEQKTRLRIQATLTIESDGLRSGRNRHMATIRDRLGDRTATQRLGSIKYLLMRANLRPVCWLWLNRSSTASLRAASAARAPIELTENPNVFKELHRNSHDRQGCITSGLATIRPELSTGAGQIGRSRYHLCVPCQMQAHLKSITKL
jgi:hypothetical protein